MMPRDAATSSVASLRRKLKGAITSKIKHAIKLKTSPARLAQLLHNYVAALIIAFCFSLQPMTALRRTPSLAAS